MKLNCRQGSSWGSPAFQLEDTAYRWLNSKLKKIDEKETNQILHSKKRSKDEDGSFIVFFDKVNKCHTFLKIPYTQYAWWGLSSSLLFENIADQ